MVQDEGCQDSFCSRDGNLTLRAILAGTAGNKSFLFGHCVKFYLAEAFDPTDNSIRQLHSRIPAVP
jgi:hypothetical protein